MHLQHWKKTVAGWMMLILLITGALSGCEQYSALSQSVFMMSPQEEQQLGGQLAGELRPKQKFITDAEVNRYVQGVAERVWRNAPRSEVPAKFFVIEDKTINAYAIPGGNIYIQSGLINAADNEAELAGVIAHEAGHVIMRHGAKQASNQMGISLLAQVIGGTSAGKSQLAQMATSLAAQGSLAHYSRQDESEADGIAVRTLYRAGYDPRAMGTFFQKLAAKYGSGGGGLAQMFSSHPATQERMNNVSQLVSQLPKQEGERPTQGLRATQGRLRQLGIE